jgi:hypothetical protein
MQNAWGWKPSLEDPEKLLREIILDEAAAANLQARRLRAGPKPIPNCMWFFNQRGDRKPSPPSIVVELARG